MEENILLIIFITFYVSCKPGDIAPEVPSPITNEENVGLEPTTRLVVISDLNSSYGSTKYNSRIPKAVSQIVEYSPDVVIVTGDMVAGQKKNLNYTAMWRAFHKVVTIPLKEEGISMAVTPGNHDASGLRSFKNERDIFVDEWANEYKDWLTEKSNINFIDKSNYPIYYSFSINDVFFISLDSATLGKMSKTQKVWIESQLKENSKEFKHKIVYGHIPLVPFAQKRENDFLVKHNPKLVELFKRHNVSLILSGHHHAYYPGRYEGLHVVGQACLGGGPRKLIGSSKTSPYSFTMVEISDDGIKVDAYKSPTFKQIVKRTTLPKQIKYKGYLITRDDL